MNLPKRFRGVIERVGESMTIASAITQAIVAPLSASEAADYVNATELEGANRPLQLAYVPFDAAANAEDAVTWQAHPYNVLRAIDLRYQGETFARMLVLEAT